MPSRRSIIEPASQPDTEPATGGALVRRLAAAALGVAALLVLAQLPAPLVFPASSALLVTAGFGLAAVAFLKGVPMQRGRVGAYEVAGALVFLGFAAALLADSDQALALLEQMDAPGLAALTK